MGITFITLEKNRNNPEETFLKKFLADSNNHNLVTKSIRSKTLPMAGSKGVEGVSLQITLL